MIFDLILWAFTDPNRYDYYRICRRNGFDRQSSYRQAKHFG